MTKQNQYTASGVLLVKQDESWALNRNLTYYLAGPMSGYENYNYPVFAQYCSILRSAHVKVKSPHEVDYPDSKVLGDLPYQVYIDGGLKLLDECDGLILMPGWPQSTGAQLELSKALERHLPVYFAIANTNTDGEIWSLDLISMNRSPAR